MEFKEIKQWLVEDKQARPVNNNIQPEEKHYYLRKSDGVTWGDFYNKTYQEFEQLAKHHAYATDAPDGIHSDEMFGEVEWQMYDNNEGYEQWIKSSNPDRDKDNGYRIRQFLPFKLPTPLEYKISTSNGVTTYSPVHPEMNTVGRGIVNPNANAIKVIEQYKVELEIESNDPESGFSTRFLKAKIESCNHILKLLQS